MPAPAPSSWLVTGATGMLGRRFLQVLAQRGMPATGAERSGAVHSLDITDAVATQTLLEFLRPAVIVNCAAEVDLQRCETMPSHAFAINAHAVEVLSRYARHAPCQLVQISTDQYYAGAGDAAHDEDAPVTPRNVYAASKYAGEVAALTAPHALVVRTSITDVVGGRGKVPFARWAIEAAQTGPVPGFVDYYASTIDALSFAEVVIDLVALKASGVLNVAARDVVSKATFITRLLRAVGNSSEVTPVSAVALTPPRCLAAGPRYVLLDEPFAGVDPIAVGEIRTLVAHLKDRGIGVLITDHNVRETLGIVDRAYILHDGRVLMSGTADEVVRDENVRRVYLGQSFRVG